MIGGALIVAVCLLVLGWTGEIVRIFVREPETVGDRTIMGLGFLLTRGYRRNHARSRWLSLLSTLWILLSTLVGALLAQNGQISQADAEIVQSSCRSLIVDTLPIAKQQLGSAWGTRFFPTSESILILRS